MRTIRVYTSRVTLYNDELGDEICRRASKGETLGQIAEELGFTRQAIYAWRRAHPEFGRKLEQAMHDHADALVDDIVRIADTDSDAQRARNRIEARMRRAATIKPREYGNRVDLNVTNQADIAAALAEARRRALPMRDQAPTLIPQVIDGQAVLVPGAPGCNSVPADPARMPSIFD